MENLANNELKIFKGLDHNYPDNFNEILLECQGDGSIDNL